MAVTVAQIRSQADQEKLFTFRYHVYAGELGLSLPQADHERKRLWDPLDDVSVSYALLDNNEVVGSLRVTYLDQVSDPTPLIERFSMQSAIAAVGIPAICTTSRFILHPRLRHGLSIFRLMQAAYEDAARRGNVRLVYGDCSPHLLPFYEHMGFRRYTRSYNDTAYGFKTLMLMLGRDQQRFAQVRSPLLRAAAQYPDDPDARTWFAQTYPDYLDQLSAALMPEGVFFDLLSTLVSSDPLHHLRLLHGLERPHAEQFLADATTVKAEPGDRVIRQGEQGDALFVLLSGIAEVTLDERPGHPLAVLGAGDTFGEMGFLTTQPRTANVVAKTPCEMVVLSGDALKRFIAKEPAIASKVLLNLSSMLAQRLAVTTHNAVQA